MGEIVSTLAGIAAPIAAGFGGFGWVAAIALQAIPAVGEPMPKKPQSRARSRVGS